MITKESLVVYEVLKGLGKDGEPVYDKLVARYLVGRNRTATDKKGTYLHAVSENTTFGHAVCGAEPGRRSNGWSTSKEKLDHITCKLCLMILKDEKARKAKCIKESSDG